MTTYIFIDTNDFTNITDINNLEISQNMTQKWSLYPKTIKIVPALLDDSVWEFKDSVWFMNFIAFIKVPIGSSIIIPKIIKIDFYNRLYNDNNMVDTLNLDDTFKFIGIYTRHIVETDTMDNYTIFYDCPFRQNMRIRRTGEFVLKLKTEDNILTSFDRFIASIAILPYIHDAFYRHHTLHTRI